MIQTRLSHPDAILTPVEARVMGSLIEKELITPQYYPLTANAPTDACNRINNRDPVVSYEEPAGTG